MTFMNVEETDRCMWWEIDGTQGVFYYLEEYFTREQAIADYLGEPFEDGVRHILGYGVRLSAAGYLDCTDWEVFESPEKARRRAQELREENEADA